jgi:methionyl-tRNA formyltransferase
MRILFWGTPEFAAAPLRALLGEGHEVVGVVTQPDKPQGRDRRPTPPPVKRIALEENIPVFQPVKPSDPEFREMAHAIAPDISIVVAYGHILPQQLIDIPVLGTLNIHASLLPTLRGAAPIQAAILQGATETGVSIMRMVRELDAGPVLLQMRTPVLEDETYGELQMRLAELGSLAMIETLALVSVGAAREIEQDHSRATYAPKITREMARIDWSRPAVEVSRGIRAYDPKPGAFTTRMGKDLKVFAARVTASSASGKPGEVIRADETLVVACSEDAVTISDVQPSGRARMLASEWVRGRGVSVGDILGT